MSAGGFVSVPLAFAAKLLAIPVIVHQQDVRAGLANKLMAKVAKKVTVTFSESIDDYGEKAVLTGNPVRQAFKGLGNKYEFLKSLNLQIDKPILTIIGGGQGSKKINDLVGQSVSYLNKELQIVHITGSKNKKIKNQNNYLSYSFVSAKKMAQIMSVSDLLVSRCGLGFISELSYLKKTVIFIPMPFSHQEDNAKLIAKHGAGMVLDQNNLTDSNFKENILNLVKDKNKSLEMANNLYSLISKEAEKNISYIIEKYVK
jgi:UDP-N-acetylglucosamine--N-acetylmuramyl-(pentapeptide) pyrophosphoryl-undecaprenol N-acetylglucosamine transferase